MKKESRRILYITMDVFVVLLCVVMTMVRSSYRENQQQSRESARKILNMYSYNLQQQLRKSEEVAEVMKGVVISYKGIPDNFDEVVRPLYFQQGWINNVDLAPNGQVTVVYPELEKKYTVIDLFQDAMTGATAQYSRDKGVMVAKGPYILDDTYRQGIVLRDPIYLQDENGNRTFWGFSDVNINLAQIVLPIMTSMDANGFNYMLYKQMSPLSEDIRLISHSKVFPREPIQVNFEWASCTWELYLEPKGGWRVTPFTEILSITGILISLLITALVNILLRLRLRNRYVRQLARLDKLTGLYNRRDLWNRHVTISPNIRAAPWLLPCWMWIISSSLMTGMAMKSGIRCCSTWPVPCVRFWERHPFLDEAAAMNLLLLCRLPMEKKQRRNLRPLSIRPMNY